MKKQNNSAVGPVKDRSRLRRGAEVLANFGLVLVAVGLISPLLSIENVVWFAIFKWAFAVGAVAYLGARVAGSIGKDESFRIRRLRRLEVWAGVAFCIAAFFWFYNTGKIHSEMLTFRMFNETIVFTLVGAMIQVVASWMISARLKKEQQQN